MRNEFPGLYFIEFRFGEMKITTQEYYHALHHEGEIEGAAQTLSQALDKDVETTRKALKCIRNVP